MEDDDSQEEYSKNYMDMFNINFSIVIVCRYKDLMSEAEDRSISKDNNMKIYRKMSESDERPFPRGNYAFFIVNCFALTFQRKISRVEIEQVWIGRDIQLSGMGDSIIWMTLKIERVL